MTDAVLDDRGVVVSCERCGQRNRITYGALGETTRCGRCKSNLPPVDSPVVIQSEADFDALVASASLPVLVDFWASWCGPCKMVAPEVEKVASGNAGRVIVAKVSTEDLPTVAQRLQVSSIPTLALFVHGRETGRLAGARPAAAIQSFIDQSVAV